LSNNTEVTARALVIRYARRNRVEDGLGSVVNFLHLDCLASEVHDRYRRPHRLTADKSGFRLLQQALVTGARA
jgi:hypothetical protein